MHIRYTSQARKDLTELLGYATREYPESLPILLVQLRRTERQIREYPESLPLVTERPTVRIAKVSRYPYRIFFRIQQHAIEVLFVHHTARKQ